MATKTVIKEATNAEGQSIKLTVAYDDQVHENVCRSSMAYLLAVLTDSRVV
jgi:hypothetical protein